MNEKWTLKDLGITIGFSLIYFVVTLVVMMSGSFTPITWIFMTALIGLLAGIPYIYITAREQKVGVLVIMNLVVGLIFFAAGELSNLVIVTLTVSVVLAEIARKLIGYDSIKGSLLSYVFFSFGMSGSPIYIWVFHDYTIEKTIEEMSSEYAVSLENMSAMWVLVVMIIMTIICAMIGGIIGKNVLRKRIEKLGLS